MALPLLWRPSGTVKSVAVVALKKFARSGNVITTHYTDRLQMESSALANAVAALLLAICDHTGKPTGGYFVWIEGGPFACCATSPSATAESRPSPARHYARPNRRPPQTDPGTTPEKATFNDETFLVSGSFIDVNPSSSRSG
jgi:hypothetical protein